MKIFAAIAFTVLQKKLLSQAVTVLNLNCWIYSLHAMFQLDLCFFIAHPVCCLNSLKTERVLTSKSCKTKGRNKEGFINMYSYCTHKSTSLHNSLHNFKHFHSSIC